MRELVQVSYSLCQSAAAHWSVCRGKREIRIMDKPDGKGEAGTSRRKCGPSSMSQVETVLNLGGHATRRKGRRARLSATV